jgi:protease-4
MKLAHVIEKILYAPWLITAGGYKAIKMLIESKLADSYDGVDLTRVKTDIPDTVASSLDLFDMKGTDIEWRVDNNGIGHVPIRGVLGQRLSGLEKICGGTDYLDIQKATTEALDRGARGMMFQIDSSGGMVRGCADLAHHIKGLPVPTLAYTDSRCNSAAYWLASACNEVMASHSSDVGSIGVILPWVDMTKVWEVGGLKYDPFVNAGADLKGAGAGPSLTDAQKEHLQEAVNHVGKNFQQFIRDNRANIDSAVFRAGTYFGDQAQEVGLIDGVGSYDDAYKALLTRVKNGNGRAPDPLRTKNQANKMTREELEAQHPELYQTLVQENETAARAAQEAARTQERNRLAELDALNYSPECQALVTAAKADGRTAQAIGLEIAKLLAKDNDHLKLQVGVYKGAKSTSDVASVDPTSITDVDTQKALVGKVSEAFRKRYIGNGRTKN